MRIAGALSLLLLAGACSSGSPKEERPTQEMMAAAKPDVHQIGALQLARMMDNGDVAVIDVRTAEEFAEGHIKGALNMPLDSFDPDEVMALEADDVVLYCRSDRRSNMAAAQLSDATGEPVTHLDGGIVAWQEAGQSVALGAS